MSSIVPTIGRKVWYWSASTSCVNDDKQAFDATVIYVHNPTTVDLMVTNHAGTTYNVRSANLRDPGFFADCHSVPAPYATWMPFQVGQVNRI